MKRLAATLEYYTSYEDEMKLLKEARGYLAAQLAMLSEVWIANVKSDIISGQEFDWTAAIELLLTERAELLEELANCIKVW